MPDFDDLLNQHQTEIEREKSEYGGAIQTEIPRDPLRRPWHQRSTPDFVEQNKTAFRKKGFPWYASFGGIFRVLRKRWRASLIGAIVAAAVIGVIALSVTPTYNSTLHLYAPDKVDSIVSRLGLLTNQLEFASLPIEFRVPISLLSRRLRDEAARQSVVEKLLASERLKDLNIKVDPSSVRVETFYASGQELLVIQGFGNHPEVALEVTNFYWKYLEGELETIRKAYFARIEEWIKVREMALDRDISNLSATLGKSTAKISGTGGQSPLQQRLQNDLAELEMKKLAMQKEIEILGRSLSMNSLEELRKITDPDVRELLEVRGGLKAETGSSYDFKAHVAEVEEEIRGLVKRRLDERQLQLQQANSDILRFSRQLDSFRTTEGEQQIESEGFRDSQQQLRTLEAQRGDLEKLKAQLALENQVGSVTFKAVQPPFADSGTVRPQPKLVAFVILAGSLLCGLFTAIFMQFIWPVEADQTERPLTMSVVEGPAL